MSQDRQNQLKLFQLQVLIAVANCGSFSEAAQQLQLSQSAVSYAIAGMEEELGVILLSRGHYGAQLTPVGEEILDRAHQVVYLLDEIVNQANFAKGLHGGHVRISSFRSAATHILPNVIAEFCRRYPEIAVSISDYDDRPEVEDNLRKGRTDIGITYLPTDRDFDTWELMQDEFVVLCPPSFELAHTHFSWNDLTIYPLVMAPEGDTCDTMVYAHCAKHSVKLQATYQIRSDATIVNMVAKGLGLTICPRLSAEPIPEGVKVFSLPVPYFRIICIATVTDALLTPATYAFLDLLKKARL